MKITVLAPNTFGYIDTLVEKLEEYPNRSITYINYDAVKFKYTSSLSRVYNFFLKIFLGKNLKKKFITEKMILKFSEMERQDFILVIRPDKLEKELLLFLKGKTQKLISYYFDSISTFPDKAKLISCFDIVYSFEKADVKNYNLKFITNFIPCDDKIEKCEGKGVFNISSKDSRLCVLQKIAEHLKTHKFPFKFIIRSEKLIPLDNIEVTQHYMGLDKTKKYIQEASILLDIQKEEQEGLTFRVFEVLQFKKKMITTNSDIKNYDFYHPDNILIIDKKNPVINEDFLQTPYKILPDSIIDKYRRKAWIELVFEV